MTKYFFRSRIFLVLAIACCTACEAVLDAPTWEPELLGPVAISNLQLEDITQLNQRKNFSVPILAGDDMGLSNTTFPDTLCTGYDFSEIGPVEISYQFSQFDSVEVDSALFIIRIENNLPLTISENTIIEIRNKTSGSLVYSFNLSSVIGYDTDTSLVITLIDKNIEPNLELYIIDFECAGAEPNAALSIYDHILLELELSFIKIAKAYIKPAQTLYIADTTNFNLEGERPVVTTIDGWFIVFVDNGFPFKAQFQAYFPSNTIVPLYNTPFIVESAEVDMSGEVSASVESKDSVYMNNDRIDEILDAKKVFFELKLSSDPLRQTVADNDNSIQAQIVGDLKIKVN